MLSVLSLLLVSPLSSSTLDSLTKGSSLSVDKPNDVLTSPNRAFSAGFHCIGENAYFFAVWYTQPLHDDGNRTVVWMANRDQPVNGEFSKLSLLRNGDLELTDAGQIKVWSTNTQSISHVKLQLQDNGNLVIISSENTHLWQSFDSPTDTLLPNQQLTAHSNLVSSRSLTNFSSGFYKLYFDSDNVLRLIFDGPEISSVYWPSPWLVSWAAGRSTYDPRKIAEFNDSGYFQSTDNLEFSASDFGIGPHRRLVLDVDGNIRLYSLNQMDQAWFVSWQAFNQPCKIHGICGVNSLCTYVPHEYPGRRCSCLPGYKLKNVTDWSSGCEPEFHSSCERSQVGFLKIPHVEFYGYDIRYFENYTLEMCENECLKYCHCKGFQFKFDNSKGVNLCFPKTLLFNGYRALSFQDSMYIRLPKDSNFNLTSHDNPGQELYCASQHSKLLDRPYRKEKVNATLKFMVWFASGLGVIEVIGFLFVWFYLYCRSHRSSNGTKKGYLQVATRFKRFSYGELKKATGNFSVEIGRGGGGVVYKGTLSDYRVAAIKRLNDAKEGEEEFLAEVSTIGRLNHMNLIEIWGYCAEGKHRLLVYEYMEHGSLAQNLISNTLDWKKRFEIAMGTAKGLAYLHEECLEWILHCDVKPQNILLDSSYKPKVADFGLSKLLNRGGIGNSRFSRIRGTRGYMAPEWIFNLPITSKVDVYSYGIVMLEMITGRSVQASDEIEGMEPRRLVMWVREKMNENEGILSWIEEIVDPTMDDEYDMDMMELLVTVALQCAEEDKDARPSMSKVVEMLLPHER